MSSDKLGSKTPRCRVELGHERSCHLLQGTRGQLSSAALAIMSRLSLSYVAKSWRIAMPVCNSGVPSGMPPTERLARGSPSASHPAQHPISDMI